MGKPLPHSPTWAADVSNALSSLFRGHKAVQHWWLCSFFPTGPNWHCPSLVSGLPGQSRNAANRTQTMQLTGSSLAQSGLSALSSQLRMQNPGTEGLLHLKVFIWSHNFFFLAAPHGMWDLSSPTKDQTHIPCIGRQSLNHWTSREIPEDKIKITSFYSPI